MREGWIILRCAGRSTLRLAETLREDGYEAWTPVRETKVRKPRWNFARDVRLPLMPSFVFVRRRHLFDLLEIEASPSRRGNGRTLPAHADFSLFRHFDRIPVVSDLDLAPLRAEESALPAPDELQALYRKGDKVVVTGGIFSGMAGVVERGDGSHTLVRFGTRYRVKISTFILQPNLSYRAEVARKAA